MLVMNVFSRRIVGFGVERAYIDSDPCIAYSTAPSQVSPYRSGQARITTHCFAFSVGSLTYACVRSRRSSRLPTSPLRNVRARPRPRQLSCCATRGSHAHGLFQLPMPHDIAVGMPVAQHPPHRSERAQFTHSAPTSGG